MTVHLVIVIACVLLGILGFMFAGESFREANLPRTEMATAPHTAYRRAVIALLLGLAGFGVAAHIIMS